MCTAGQVFLEDDVRSCLNGQGFFAGCIHTNNFPCSKAGMTSFWTRLLVKGKLVKGDLVVWLNNGTKTLCRIHLNNSTASFFTFLSLVFITGFLIGVWKKKRRQNSRAGYWGKGRARLAYLTDKELECYQRFINRVWGLCGKVFARSLRKTRRQISPSTDQANEVNKTFIIWLLLHFLLCL